MRDVVGCSTTGLLGRRLMARERYSGAWERGFAAQVAVQAHFESSPGLPSFFGHLTATLAELLGARIVLFGRLDADGRLLTLQPRAHGLSDDQIVALGAIPVAPDAPGLASRVVYGGVVFRGDLRPDDPEVAPWRGVLTARDAADAVAVSWRAADQPLGILVALGSTRAGF